MKIQAEQSVKSRIGICGIVLLAARTDRRRSVPLCELTVSAMLLPQ